MDSITETEVKSESSTSEASVDFDVKVKDLAGAMLDAMIKTFDQHAILNSRKYLKKDEIMKVFKDAKEALNK